MSRISCLAQRFTDDTRGAIAVVFGLSLIVLLCCGALALDSSRAYNVRTKVQAALDAAALAGAKKLDEEGTTNQDVIDVATAFFDTHRPMITMDGLVLSGFEALPDKGTSTVVTQIHVTLRSIFSDIAGLGSDLTFTPIANAVYKSKKVELALVLDITGSMNNPASKIAALKVAAKDMVDTLFSANPLAGQVRVSLIPYSASVNVGSFYEEATGDDDDDDTCVVERSGAEAYTDAPPGAGAHLSTSSTSQNSWYRCPSEPIIPLTDLSIAADRTAFKASIDGIAPIGATAGHIGAAWGWYTLSPEWASFWPAANRPKNYSPDVHKIVILMTDGMFNTAYRNGGLGLSNPDNEDPLTAGSSANQALQLCDGIKDQGITIYTVAFLAPTSAESLLQQCSGVDNFYNADTSSQLLDAFRAIVEKLTNLRIAS